MIGAMARIEDYALLGDLQTAALVSTAGSIDWLCLPKFDSPACFAALLDTPDAGHWIVAPAAGGVCTRRRYVKDTLVLETEWVSGDGTVRVIDFMPPRGHALDVVRIVESVHGSVAMRSERDHTRFSKRLWVKTERVTLRRVPPSASGAA